MTEPGGRGDPARSLALLWRERSAPSGARGKAPLGPDRIVRAAITLADKEGLAAVSMRRLAETLGVGTMSLYTHVPGRAELVDAMLDTVYGEMTRAEHGKASWRARLERVAQENWALHVRHSWTLHVVTSRPVLGPHAIAKYDHELRAVEGIGLTDVEMDSVLSLVLDHAESAARRALEAAHVERQSGMTDAQWWNVHGPLLAKMLDPGRFPTASRVGSAAGAAHGSAHAPAHAFAFGLERILDGVEKLVAQRARGSRRSR